MSLFVLLHINLQTKGITNQLRKTNIIVGSIKNKHAQVYLESNEEKSTQHPFFDIQYDLCMILQNLLRFLLQHCASSLLSNSFFFVI